MNIYPTSERRLWYRTQQMVRTDIFIKCRKLSVPCFEEDLVLWNAQRSLPLLSLLLKVALHLNLATCIHFQYSIFASIHRFDKHLRISFIYIKKLLEASHLIRLLYIQKLHSTHAGCPLILGKLGALPHYLFQNLSYPLVGTLRFPSFVQPNSSPLIPLQPYGHLTYHRRDGYYHSSIFSTIV